MSDNQPQAAPGELLVGIMTVKDVKFYSMSSGYCIVDGITEATKKSGGLTFKGPFLEYPERGQVYCVKGRMKFDKKFNKKYFEVEFSKPQEAKTEHGWIEYLIKECPRVSEMRATELVEAFGTKVVEELASGVDKIMQVKSGLMKIPVRRDEAEKIHNWAVAELRLSRMKAWLYEKGLTYSLVHKIVYKYGANAPTVVRNDPFSLTEIDGIGFLTADKIAKAVKIPPESPQRIQAAIMYTIAEEMEQGGHTCITEQDLVQAVYKLIGVHHQHVSKAIADLLSLGKLCNASSDIVKFSQHGWLFEELKNERIAS